jgi:integrase/recombinase XerC
MKARNYRNDLIGNKNGTKKGFFQFLSLRNISNLGEVNKTVLRDYLGYLAGCNIATTSISRKLSAVRSFYRYLSREKIIDNNPVDGMSSPRLEKRLPEFLTIEEVNSLLASPDAKSPAGMRDRAIIELIYAAGLRVSEIAGLDIEDVDLASRTIRVLGKGNKERIAVIGEPARAALLSYLENGRQKLKGNNRCSRLFINYQGQPLTSRWMQMLVSKYAAACGLQKKVHPHTLRHTFATHLLDGGADLRVVQELLGHSNLSTTQIYTHITKAQAKKIYLSSHPMAIGEKNDE